MQTNTVSYDKLIEKWAPVLNEESAGKINDHHKKAVTAAKSQFNQIMIKGEYDLTIIIQILNYDLIKVRKKMFFLPFY